MNRVPLEWLIRIYIVTLRSPTLHPDYAHSCNDYGLWQLAMDHRHDTWVYQEGAA